MTKHDKERKVFESYFPLPDGMEWDSNKSYYCRTNSTILLGDCMKWDRMLQVWLTAKKLAKKGFRKK